MSLFTNEERVLVAGHLAALREQGWPAGRALSMVASRLPSGASKDELARVAAALERGDELVSAGTEPLLALLARGESAGPAALEEATRGFALATEATDAERRLRALLFACAAGLLTTALTFAIVVPSFARLFADLGGALPAPTQFIVDTWGVLAFLLVCTAGGAITLGLRPPSALRGLSGARALASASNLRVFAAAVDAGLDEREALGWLDRTKPARLDEAPALGLDAFERHLARNALERDGSAAAARLLADERARDGARPARLLSTFGPLAAITVFGWLVGGLLIAVYLPIFSIAGAIR